MQMRIADEVENSHICYQSSTTSMIEVEVLLINEGPEGGTED